ncbi:hypothetical protein [Streptomyces sp. NPDC046942]|uniref:hypothetical protein n=1 Tax=Streptomyces sp. NPDC046942 TaxID=3155137 RepID=UPI00340658C6
MGDPSEELGFEGLLGEEGFFARLLGRSPSGGGRAELYGPDLPVVLLTGGPGMGKGRLLDVVWRQFATQLPVVRLDCGSGEYADRAAREKGARSAATEILVEAARTLRTWPGTGGSFLFPRFFSGLVLVTTGVTGGTPRAVRAEIERYTDLPEKRRLRALFTGGFWRDRGVVRNLLAALEQPLDGAAVGTALLAALDTSLTPKGRRELTRIYGAYLGADRRYQHGLRSLAADFRARGEGREVAESFLFWALREDLEAAYAGVLAYLSRVGRPAMLLDRSESPLGEQLLRAVLTDRRAGRRDRVVIVGTARRADGGAFLYGGLRREEVLPPAEFRPADEVPPAWSRRKHKGTDLAPLADGVLLLRMPLLTGDQIGEETARRQLRAEPEGGTNRRRIDAAVARLSGGRPHMVLRLAAAAAAFQMPADANDRDLLDAPLHLAADGDGEGDGERPVFDVLLRELILKQLPVRLPQEHHGQWLDLLTHLSVAHDMECADVLLDYHQRGRLNRLTAHQVGQLLADTGWPSCERHFIGDFGLRQLLVHRLYGLHPDGAAWYDDHRLLRNHYSRRAKDEATADGGATADGEATAHVGATAEGGAFRSVMAHRMNHHLVSGGVDGVVGHLVATLPGRPLKWCAELLEIAQAPYPGGADTRRQRAEGLVALEGDALRRTVDRLLHAVWLCEERTRPTGQETAGTLARLLDLLSIMEFDGAGQLGRVATEWRSLAENELPLLGCACTGQLGRRR